MPLDPAQAVARCQTILAHAWMVRTFVKHSPEVEDFPELMEIARTVFDMARALETRTHDPAGYLKLLGKKISKLRRAADQFRHDAQIASTHTNFQQAVLSIDACVAELEGILHSTTAAGILPAGMPASTAPGEVVADDSEDQSE